MQKPKEKNWFFWNLPNIITCMRVTGPFWFFIFPLICPIEIKILMLIYIGLLITDLIDGITAQLVGNSGGIGILLDPVADKILNASFFLKIYLLGILDNLTVAILIAVVYQEYRVSRLVIDAINLVKEKDWRENARLRWREKVLSAYFKVREGIVNDMKIHKQGKYKMAAYAFGGYFFFWNYIFSHKILYWYSEISFCIGIYLSFISLRKYRYDYEVWKSKFLSQG